MSDAARSSSASTAREAFARRRKEHPGVAPFEKRHTKLFFRVVELMAERGLREVEAMACARDAAGFGDSGDELQMPDLKNGGPPGSRTGKRFL